MQQINLYLQEFRPKSEWFSARQGVVGALILVVLLLVYSGIAAYQNQLAEQRIEQERQQLAELRAQVEQLSRVQPNDQLAHIESDRSQLQAEIERREHLLTVIRQQNLGNAEGFSEQMLTMARQSLETLQLNQISLQAGGSYVEFSGLASQADQVPLYLQRLRSESSFAQVRFGVIDVARSSGREPLQFSVTRVKEERR